MIGGGTESSISLLMSSIPNKNTFYYPGFKFGAMVFGKIDIDYTSKDFGRKRVSGDRWCVEN